MSDYRGTGPSRLWLRIASSFEGGIGAWSCADLLDEDEGTWIGRVASLEIERRNRLEEDEPPCQVANVRPIRLVPGEPSAEIVSGLETLLARARRGEFLAVAFAGHVRPSDTATFYSLGGGGDVAHLVTAIERVKLRLLAAGAEDSRPW